jgi:hypothetical protein
MFRTFFVGAVSAYAVMAGMARIAPGAIITGFNLPAGPTIPVSTPAPNNDNTVTAQSERDRSARCIRDRASLQHLKPNQH